MSATSWSRFYWNDWRSDPKLRMCSIAARGLWIELLAIMAEASPRGHLLVNGQKPDTKLIRTLAGIERNHVGKLLKELEQAGVFSRTEDGVIFSRRMVRDEAKAAERRHWGSLGGNPNLKARDKVEDKPDHKVEDKGDLIPARARPSPSPSPERKKEEVGARKSAAPPDGGFAFLGRIIKLNARDLEEWRTSFSAIPDIVAELRAIDAKLADDPPKNGKWFARSAAGSGRSTRSCWRKPRVRPRRSAATGATFRLGWGADAWASGQARHRTQAARARQPEDPLPALLSHPAP